MRTLTSCLIGLGALAAWPSYACRCIEPPSIEQAYAQAALVVLGDVAQVEGDPYGPGGATVTISVLQSWKQPASRQLTVITSSSCAFNFQPDQRALLYLQATAETAVYTARACQGSAPVEAAGEKLLWLMQHIPPASCPACAQLKP